MAVSFSTQTPTYATVNTGASVTFSLSAGGNFLRLWCTAAPDGAKLKSELDQSSAARVFVFEGDATATWKFMPDAGGVFVFAAQEYTKGATPGFRGAYTGDPRGFETETKIGSEASLSIQIGQRITQKLGVGSDTATLAIHVFGATIRATTFDVHGETTPFLLEASTTKAKTAVVDATVLSSLAALVAGGGVAAATALGTLSSIADDIIQKFNAHRSQATVHAANDPTNVISRAYESPTTPASLQRTVAEILRMLDRHMRNDDGSSAGTGGVAYHFVGSINRADWANALIAQPPGDLTACIVGLSDAWRAYEGHRVNTGVHTSADTVNTLTALSPLLTLHKAFLSSIQATSPTPPNTANAGVVTLVHGGGFKFA